MKRGLYITKLMLINASGISEAQINKDINNRQLKVIDNEKIWYRDALNYVFEKWKEGRIKMYPAYSEQPDDSFASRLLSLIDDEMAMK